LTQDLRAQRDVSCEVLFADNGSTDGTVETLANLWPGRTQANSSNLGYTAAQRQNLSPCRRPLCAVPES
jgi:glycosyltransferase involved in cell wall biosynthesis